MMNQSILSLAFKISGISESLILSSFFPMSDMLSRQLTYN